RSSCGVCGLTDPGTILEDTPALLPGTPRVNLADLEAMRVRFEESQDLFRATGASHSAAVFGADGRLWALGEDVGRHNALDKLLGACVRAKVELSEGFVLVSSRCSYELVEKCARLGVKALASLSAPTAFAVRKAEEARLALYCRSDDEFLRVGRLSDDH
ncbi:MAG: formate dehydrogenase accessory sulfurtransferase FdhD, partial [Pseudomonadota bacterium]